jgi:inosine/xanthosine triphosphatase
MKIVVASKSPVKIAAALEEFRRMFPEITYTHDSVSVPSGVSEQPMTDAETLTGAMNRVENARRTVPDADYWVGIEGGCEDHGEDMVAFAWVAVASKDGKTSKARAQMFLLPKQIAELIRGGMELGPADDKVFGRTNSKQQNGTVGLLTGDALNRTSYYTDAVIFALIPFKNQHLY